MIKQMEKFKLYQQYIINYSDASQSLEKHIKDSKNFSVIIKVLFFHSFLFIILFIII